MAATPGMTSRVVRMVDPSDIRSATLLSLARAFEDFVGDDRDGFGMVELQPLGPALARQLGGGKDGEAFKLGRREQHARIPLTRKQAQMRAGMARRRGIHPRHEAFDFSGIRRHRR